MDQNGEVEVINYWFLASYLIPSAEAPGSESKALSTLIWLCLYSSSSEMFQYAWWISVPSIIELKLGTKLWKLDLVEIMMILLALYNQHWWTANLMEDNLLLQ